MKDLIRSLPKSLGIGIFLFAFLGIALGAFLFNKPQTQVLSEEIAVYPTVTPTPEPTVTPTPQAIVWPTFTPTPTVIIAPTTPPAVPTEAKKEEVSQGCVKSGNEVKCSNINAQTNSNGTEVNVQASPNSNGVTVQVNH